MDITELSAMTAVTLGMTQILKLAFNVKDRFVPLINLCVGVSVALVFISCTRASALQGIFAALSASGLFSGTKNVIS